jgi:hypothetical protein
VTPKVEIDRIEIRGTKGATLQARYARSTSQENGHSGIDVLCG